MAEDKKYIKVAFKTNIASTFIFNFAKPREVKPDPDDPEKKDWGSFYVYGVTEDGTDKYMKATPALYKILDDSNLLKRGSVVTILKGEKKNPDTGKTTQYWEKVEIDGVNVTTLEGEPGEEKAPLSDDPPPVDVEAQEEAPGLSKAAALRLRVATTMHQAYEIAEKVRAIHTDPMAEYDPSLTSSCAHSIFIELSKKGYRPTTADIQRATDLFKGE